MIRHKLTECEIESILGRGMKISLGEQHLTTKERELSFHFISMKSKMKNAYHQGDKKKSDSISPYCTHFPNNRV
jgi:hypothetical protein